MGMIGHDVLALLKKSGPMCQPQIVKATGFDYLSVTASISGLLSRKLIVFIGWVQDLRDTDERMEEAPAHSYLYALPGTPMLLAVDEHGQRLRCPACACLRVFRARRRGLCRCDGCKQLFEPVAAKKDHKPKKADKPAKYRGQPAGKITIGRQYKWGHGVMV